MHHHFRSLAGILALSLLVTVVLTRLTHASPPPCNGNYCTEVSNPNGTFYVAWTIGFCTDPNTGNRVHYEVYYPYSWTDNATGATHQFSIVNFTNNSPPICGPPRRCQASGAATDGSGFTINTFACTNNVYIYDKNGNLVYH